jgi:hypothetical protein
MVNGECVQLCYHACNQVYTPPRNYSDKPNIFNVLRHCSIWNADCISLCDR